MSNLDNLEDSSYEGGEFEGEPCDSAALAVARKSQPSTRVSLFVEALLRSVINNYETDSRKAARTYKRICRRLFENGLIDESWSMTELEATRVQFEHALFRLFQESPVSSPSSPLFLHGAYFTSQYKREFEEYEKIGGGAFGKVFRVKHKLDGTEYAVKKIPIRSEGLESIKGYLSEVKTFASLNHPNIVQYKAAWLELGNSFSFDAVTNSPWGQPKVIVPKNRKSSRNSLNKMSSLCLKNNSESDFEIEFESSSTNSPTKINNRVSKTETPCDKPENIPTRKINSHSNFEIAFQHSHDPDSINESSNKHHSTDKALIPTNHAQSKLRWATLYIQMALCHGTLDQWLRRRHEAFDTEVAVVSSSAEALRNKAIQQILIQLLRGLQYIHSKGIVHHDIKPSNIFVSAEAGTLLVQLGDFGLACPLQKTRHAFARGTPLYAAPEQLAGRCDPKSDIYSVGIVLFELLEDFGTDMERTRKISELRRRQDPPVPPDLTLGNLVPALVRRHPIERPDALTLLQALENIQNLPQSNVESLEKQLEEQQKEIQRLRELLKRHGIENV